MRVPANSVRVLCSAGARPKITPVRADRWVFTMAPLIALIPALVVFAVIPFGPVVSLFGRQVSLYITDLNGVLHAISLTDCKEKWTLDLGKDPAVKAPGMIYGGPVVHAGRIFIATCNLEGPHARQPTAIICIGEK